MRKAIALRTFRAIDCWQPTNAIQRHPALFLAVVLALMIGALDARATQSVTLYQQAELQVDAISAVTIDGSTAVIGSSSANALAGAAYLITAGTGSLLQTLAAADATSFDMFGSAASLSGNTLAIGASGKSNETGAVYLFVDTNGTWSQQAEIVASDGAAGDGFGFSVALSGGTLLVGAYGAGQTGAAYVFTGSGSSWSQQQKLTASDGLANDSFGSAVALNGTTALIGAFDASNQAGAAYVFNSNGSTWVQQQKLQASDASSQGQFGFSVALAAGVALVGANGSGAHAGTGSAYVFANQGGTWSQQQELVANNGVAGDAFGRSVALAGTFALVGAPKVGQTGAAYVFAGSGSSWTQQQEIVPADIPTDFGHALVMNGDTAVIAADDAAYTFAPVPPVDVVSSLASGAGAACNGTADNTATGLAYSGTQSVFANDDTGSTNSHQDWRYVLALLYGGLDLTTPSAVPDCNSSARRALVANWSKLFQNGCAGDTTDCGPATPANGALWHAFRMDDNSGAAAVFASLLGLSPSPSNSALNGFGASPYCNAMNWDTNAGQNGNCQEGAHDQFTGPGGVPDPNSSYDLSGNNIGIGHGSHRMPPPGILDNKAADVAGEVNVGGQVWGSAPLGIAGTQAWDVLPTSMQDNDPIRRKCIGGATNNNARAGEEVCNMDGSLGVVLSMPDSDWIIGASFNGGPPLKQYPTNNCNGAWVGAQAPQIFSCAPRSAAHHDGECPNGDLEDGALCQAPIDNVNNTSACVNSAGQTPTVVNGGRVLPHNYGRVYNLQLRDGNVTQGLKFAQYPISALNTTINFLGAYNRIHEVETVVGPNAVGCQLVSTADQIGCLVQADPCSVGLAYDTAQSWQLRVDGGAPAPSTGAIRVNQLSPGAGGYPL